MEAEQKKVDASSKGIRVRLAVPRDGDALKTMLREYIVDFYGCPDPGEEQRERLVLQLSRREGGVQFVAVDPKGHEVGFATVYFTMSSLRAAPVLVLNDLYVRESARGQGIGEALFRACEAYGVANGYAAMTWETAPDNDRAQRLYDRLGGVRGCWLSYSKPL